MQRSDDLDIVRLGTAGWTIPRAVREAFPDTGSHLERYAARFTGVEINSSFYRQHRRSTYERWAASVPETFRFAVKIPRAITHDQRLVAADVLLEVFLDEAIGLGRRLGPLLVQLPPSLAFDAPVAEEFFTVLRALHRGEIACEPRHDSWFGPAADALFRSHRVARVAADPARCLAAGVPGGWPALVYLRLHGPDHRHLYAGSYSGDDLDWWAARIGEWLARGHTVHAYFNNDGGGNAVRDAAALRARVGY